MERFLKRRSATAAMTETGRPESATAPALTISRQCGAGLARLERPLLEYLDALEGGATVAWALFDQSLLGRVIEDHRLPALARPFLAEFAKFPVAVALRDRLLLPRQEWTLFNHSANAIRQLCEAGRALVVGRAGNFVTSDLGNTFHVRLVAGKESRIDFISSRHRIDRAGATELVEETDKARAGFVKRHAGADIDAAVSYHLVLNTDHFADDVAVRIIADSMHEWSQARFAGPPSGGDAAARESCAERILSRASAH